MEKEGEKKNIISRIRKRDGRIVLFDQERITNAIFKAAQAVGGTDKEIAKELSGQVVKILEERFGSDITPTVEQIQDLVEKVLIENGHAKTAKAYILYRDQRRKLREMAVLTEPIGLVEGYIRQNDWKVNENSNMTYSLQGLNNHISNAIISKYWLDKLYTPRIREAYEKGDIHIHDLGTLGAYCVGWDLKDLLLSGFKGVSGKVESKPPKHFRTSLGQAVNFFYTLQGEAAGAMAFSNFDTLLAPFIAYDKLTSAEIKQALQEFLFNMNVPTRVGFQTPFSNITLDLKVPDFMKEEYVIIGGKLMDKKYKHFQREMDLFNEILAEVILEGDASGRVFTFPIPTYNITKDFEWDNPTYDNIWEMTAKYGVPYFSNFINSDMKPDDAKSMCPLGGEEKVLIKSSRGRIVEYSTIRHIYKGHSKQEEYKVYSCGKFVKGTFNKFRNQKMIKVILVNGHELKMSTKHLNYVRAYEKSKELILKGEELKEGMYLPYSLKTYKGEGGCKELGYFVGAYAGDGSFDEDSAVVFFLEGYYKKETIDKLIKIAKDYFGAHNSIKEYKKTRLVTLKIYSKAAVGLCRDFVEGIAREKHYTAKLFIMSEEFRKGVIEGHYATDGGNRHRIYTSSKKMVETLNMLAATLGTTTSIYEDKRENRLGKEPNYAVLIYQLNRQRYGEIWFKKKEKLWVRIKDIRPISNDTAYCFEVKDDEPMFTVGTTGILTHNCRLRLDQRELRKRGGGLFGSNPLTGSIGVVTINMARIGYLAKTEEEFFERLANLMDVSKESLEVKRKVLEDFTEQNLYPYSKFYLRNMKVSTGLHWKNHFSTIGLLGMNEALLNFMQKDIASEEGKEFTIKVMDFMRKKISEYQQEIGNIYNLEATPGEGSLAPEEKVLISSSDPRLTEIGPLIDGFLEKNRDRIHKIEDTEILPLKQGTLYTYGFSRKTNKIKKYPVTSVIRHKGRSMYEIKTRLGKKVKVTGQHSVFTLNKQGDIEQIKVDKLRQGSYIAVPKRINIQPVNTKFNLIERFKSSPLKNRFYLKTSKEFIEALVNRKQIKDWTRKYYKTEYRTIKSTWKKRCVIPLRLIYDNNIKLNLKVLQKSKIIYRSTKSTKPINTQIRINHDLGFVLGGLLSEGWLGKRPSFYNTNEEYVKKFTQACDTIFGEGSYSLCLKKREKEGRKPMYTVTLSKVIGLVLKDVMQLKGLSGEKSVPSFVYASKDETIKGLLKAFTLGDGTFYSKESKGDYNIRLYTKSKDLVNGLNLLLLRLGIVAKLKKDNKSKTNPNWADGYVLEISGAEYLKKYFKLILGKKFNKKITNSGKETVPEMPKIIKNILKKHKIKLKEVGIDKDSFNRNVRKNSISVHYLKRIITQISSKLKNAEIESLKRIVDSDIFWDKITSIEKVSTPKYVYDFEVNVNGDTVENFLGGDCLICLHNTTYRFAKKDKEMYPEIIVANEKAYREKKAAPFYTNSTQLPVGHTDDIFEALILQDEIQSKYTGGTVMHCFLGEKISSVEATKALVRKIAENFKIPYFTLTPTFSICPKHGYLAGEHEYCPKCDEEIGYKEVK